MVEDRGVAARAVRCEAQLLTVTARDRFLALTLEDDSTAALPSSRRGEHRRVAVV